jgi:hypothetical protein
MSFLEVRQISIIGNLDARTLVATAAALIVALALIILPCWFRQQVKRRASRLVRNLNEPETARIAELVQMHEVEHAPPTPKQLPRHGSTPQLWFSMQPADGARKRSVSLHQAAPTRERADSPVSPGTEAGQRRQTEFEGTGLGPEQVPSDEEPCDRRHVWRVAAEGLPVRPWWWPWTPHVVRPDRTPDLHIARTLPLD